MPRISFQDIAPDFELIDTQDRIVKLSQYRNQKWVYLVFNRGFA